MPKKEHRLVHHILIGGILLFGLFGVTMMFGPADFGVFEISPTPFLIIPLYFGARYGFGPGINSGLVTIATILVVHDSDSLWQYHPWETTYAVAVFPIIGSISAEIRRFYVTKLRFLEKINREVRTSAAKLELELDLQRESNRRLLDETAQKGVTSTPMDLELRQTLSTGSAGIYGNTLEYLRRVSGVDEAVLFHRQKKSWRVIASTVTGELKDLSETAKELAEKAFEENDIVNWSSLIDNDKANETSQSVGDWLAAIPWYSPDAETFDAVLMIRKMSPDYVSWQNLARIRSICRWVAGLSVTKLTNTEIPLRPEPIAKRDFIRSLERAVDTAAVQNVSSSLLLLSPVTSAYAAENELAEVLQVTDVIVRHHFQGKVIHAILLPLAAKGHASNTLSRLQFSLGRAIKIDGNQSASQLWDYFVSGGNVQHRSSEIIPNTPGLEPA